MGQVARLRHAVDDDDLVDVEAEDNGEGDAQPGLQALDVKEEGEEGEGDEQHHDEDEVEKEVDGQAADLDGDRRPER